MKKLAGVAIALPGVVDPPVRGGGHLNTLRFADLLAQHRPVKVVSYAQREEGVPFLDDVLDDLVRDRWLLMLTWGPHVQGHLRQFHGKLPLAYYQQSVDWDIELPPDVPVISMSKFMMTWAQRRWPASPQLYLPPVLPDACHDYGGERDIDVLVVPRKQPRYVLEELVGRLRNRCSVHVLDRFVPRDELYALMNRAKVYLYAFAPQRCAFVAGGWRLMEGISTQDLEAFSCGCTVVSDLRGGQGDFLEPEVHGHRLMSHSPEWDVEQILHAIAAHPQPGASEHRAFLYDHYGEETFHRRAEACLDFLDRFAAFAADHSPSPEAFGIPEPMSSAETARSNLEKGLYRAARRLGLGRR